MVMKRPFSDKVISLVPPRYPL
ncbi:Transposase [Pseudomonas wadenswilerensis]|nr:protein of unknown function [Pseudomonas sp. JV241A]